MKRRKEWRGKTHRRKDIELGQKKTQTEEEKKKTKKMMMIMMMMMMMKGVAPPLLSCHVVSNY